nr:MAG TPA: hypothetical protein [Caudoviricetes sp.]
MRYGKRGAWPGGRAQGSPLRRGRRGPLTEISAPTGAW